MIKQFIKQVTVTGADDSIAPQELYKIHGNYPFVEFGILFSKSSEGYPRFPTRIWLNDLYKLYSNKPQLKLSMHLCGKWVRDLCQGIDTFVEDNTSILPMFSRLQLNFHTYPHLINKQFIQNLKLKKSNINQYIFQLDGKNNDIFFDAINNGINAVPLYDLSGGAGILPDKWDSPLGNYCGYAGGLSPDNIKEQLNKLNNIVGDTPIWIDAETHLRSENNQLFNINKVITFLELSKPFVIDSNASREVSND